MDEQRIRRRRVAAIGSESGEGRRGFLGYPRGCEGWWFIEMCGSNGVLLAHECLNVGA